MWVTVDDVSDNSRWRLVRPYTTLSDVTEGHVASDNASVHVIDDVTVVYKWLIRVLVGDKVSLNWTIRCERGSNATLCVSQS